MMMKTLTWFILFTFIHLVFPDTPKFTDLTEKLFGVKSDGIIAAFGDFNSDKRTDIFVINKNGKSLDLFLASQTTYHRIALIPHSPNMSNDVITAVIPGDFDGDSQMDVLVTWQLATDPQKQKQVHVDIHWGNSQTTQISGKYTLEENLRDQPLILDVDGDMIPDLLAETAPGQRFYWIASKNRNFTKTEMYHPETAGNVSWTWSPFKRPHGHAYLDLDEDFSADLFLTVEKKETRTQKQFEIWLNTNGVLKLKLNETISAPTAYWIGQPCFIDIDQNSHPDILLPVCEDKECLKSAIKIYNHQYKKWVNLFSNFNYKGNTWGFVNETKLPHSGSILPITLRMGDYNMDGYPDATIILSVKYSTGDTKQVFLLENIACGGEQCSHPRTFTMQGEEPFKWFPDPLLSTFYDINENGILDLMIVAFDKNNTPHMHAYEHIFSGDACFIKVTVVSGLCYSNCPNKKPPYGVNQPGVALKYMTTKPEGDPQQSCATQLSQAAHFALQLPYTVFGLGQTPNFLDRLSIGIPQKKDQSIRKRDWTQIIPNSQLIVIPFPNDKPKQWKNKLFITPSRLVLITGAALIGTCGFIAGLVGILHWREKREDKKEKMQDAHRFHFDAM